MTNVEYMVEKMIQHQGQWTVEMDENGNKVIVNRNGICRGVGEEDGTVINAEKIIELYNERVKIEA